MFAALGDIDINDASIEAQINEIRATLPLVDTAGIKEILVQGKEKVIDLALFALRNRFTHTIDRANSISGEPT